MIVGLTGTFGAGKTTVADYLVRQHGFVFHSCSDILRDIAKERGLEEDRDVLRELGRELKQQFGHTELARRLLEKIKKEKGRFGSFDPPAGGSDFSGRGFIVDSIRHPKEVEELRKASDFILFALDAPIELRYDRIQKRARPGDEVSFDEFKTQEEKEMNPVNPAQQIGAAMSLADDNIWNDGSPDELCGKIDRLLGF